MTLVRIATSYAVLATRSIASAWEVVSITAAWSPASTMARRAAWAPAPPGSWRARRGRRSAPDPHRDRPDHPGPDTRSFERRDREVGRCGLAVRAGDPDDRQRMGRIAVPPCGGAGQGKPGRIDDDLRRRHPDHRPFDEGRGGARLDRLCHEIVAVDPQAGDRHEQRARADRMQIVCHATHLEGAQVRSRDGPTVGSSPAQAALPRETLEQGAERSRRPHAIAAAGRAGLAHRATSRSSRAATRPIALRVGRSTRSWAPVIATQDAPKERLYS